MARHPRHRQRLPLGLQFLVDAAKEPPLAHSQMLGLQGRSSDDT
jgi:hypothetical protein